MNCRIAVDIGASGGRHIAAYLENGKIRLKEIYRFDNGFERRDGVLCWDAETLAREVVEGLRRAGEQGFSPRTVAIDTWGVDYVLLDENDGIIPPAYCYRDERSGRFRPYVEERIGRNDLFRRNGIQPHEFNTVYQICRDLADGRLDRAKCLLMMPAYLSFRLCGKMANEYTDATTGALVAAGKKEWDRDLIRLLGMDDTIFAPLVPPGTVLGCLLPQVRAAVGYDTTVVAAPSHDTAAAVAACPLDGEDAFLSSGTWSLIGVETERPVLTDAAEKAGFSNEGGYRNRFLKNYMGMWLLQSIRRDLGKKYTYDEMMRFAEEERRWTEFDVNDPSLVAPDSMIKAVRDLTDPGYDVPQILASVYHSLARGYKNAIEEIETLTGRPVKRIRIIGGGCKDKYLNTLTAQYTGCSVTAGPVEATALGNLICQMIADGDCRDLADARSLIKKSFSIEEIPV